MIKLVSALAVVLVVGGGVAVSSSPVPDAGFTLECELVDRHITCEGDIPTPTTEEPPSTADPSTSTTPASSTSTEPSTSTSLPEPSTTSPPTTAPATTTSVPQSTTSTTPPTSSPSTTPSFTATFATPDDFYDRFRTWVGNACNAAQTCEPCSAGVGICEFPGDHNTDCQGPTTARTVHVRQHAELFWWCAPNGPDTGHVMIGMNTSGYAISGFSPTRTFDDVTSICWDQNLTDLGGGKWMVLTLVPASVYERNLPRLDYTLPEFDADEAPGDFNLQRLPRWQFKLFRNELRIFDSLEGGAWGTGSGLIAGTDRATRYRHCLTENAQGIVVSQAGQSWQTTMRFPDGPVGIIWADDTYDADKHGGTGLYTWHLDNIEIR